MGELGPHGTETRLEAARRPEAGTHAATSFVPIALARPPERKVSRWVLAMIAAMLLAPAAFWIGETLSNLRTARRTHAVASSLESRTAALDVSPTFTVSTRVEPSEAEIWLDHHPVATGQLGIALPKDGSTHELRVAADGYIPVTLMFADVPPPKLIRLEPLPAGAAPPSEPEPFVAAAPPSGEAAVLMPAATARAESATPTDGSGAQPEVASDAPTPVVARVAPRAVRPPARATAPAKRRASAAANLGADTTPSAAARVVEPELPPAPHVQIIDEGAPKVRVIE